MFFRPRGGCAAFRSRPAHRRGGPARRTGVRPCATRARDVLSRPFRPGGSAIRPAPPTARPGTASALEESIGAVERGDRAEHRRVLGRDSELILPNRSRNRRQTALPALQSGPRQRGAVATLAPLSGWIVPWRRSSELQSVASVGSSPKPGMPAFASIASPTSRELISSTSRCTAAYGKKPALRYRGNPAASADRPVPASTPVTASSGNGRDPERVRPVAARRAVAPCGTPCGWTRSAATPTSAGTPQRRNAGLPPAVGLASLPR